MGNLSKRRTKTGPKPLFLCVIGPSKVGKSYFMGTGEGGNTLHIHGVKETHGADSAFEAGDSKVISVRWDDDKLMKDLKSLLSPETIKEEKIKYVCIDSLTELFEAVAETSAVKQQALTKDGKFNSFAEKKAIVSVMTKILGYLTELNENHGVHVIASLHATITKAENGEVTEVKPDLPSFGVAAFLVGAFADQMIMNRNPKTNKPEFITYANAHRESKNDEGVVTRYLDFHPCLRGVKGQLPEKIEATIPALLKLKGQSTDK